MKTPAQPDEALLEGADDHELSVMKRKGRLLGEILVDRGVVTQEALEAALQTQRDGSPMRVGEILLERGDVTEVALAAAVANQFGLPLLDVDGPHPAPEALTVFDPVTAHQLGVLPMRITHRGVIVAVAEVPTPARLRRMGEIAGRDLGIGLAVPSKLVDAISRAYGESAGRVAQERGTPTPADNALDDLDDLEPEPRVVADTESGRTRVRLGDMLLERELVSNADLQRALRHQTDSGRRLGEVLVGLGVLDERNLAHTLADQLGLPLADLRRQRPAPAATEAIPESLARSLTAVSLHIDATTLEVVVADPDHPGLIDELARASGRAVRLQLAPASEVRRAIDQSYRALAGVARHIKEFELTSNTRAEAAEPLQRAVDTNAPVVQVVNLIITQAFRDRASDIHIEPQGERIRVRMRIDGALHEVLSLPADMGQALVSRIKVMADMNIVERRRPQDGQIEMSVDGRALDIRVATAPVIFGEKVALRLLDKSRSLYKLGDLGMSPETNKVFSELVRSPFGMVICAGPTGSGKTTTLYATLAEINTAERNVMTIEDPVEYVLPSVNQIQINELADVTFADGLKSILRQDPDVILVGEIRDVETARIAVQSALTGHFVLSSLHATDAASAVHRLLDMGIEPFLIAPSILAVAGQRLVRRICRECTTRYEPSSDELAFYKQIGGPDKDVFYRGEGCNFCSGTGYQERIGVYEVLRMTDAMRQLVVHQPSQSEIRELAISEGMRPLRDEALRLVADDVTTISEILRSVYPL